MLLIICSLCMTPQGLWSSRGGEEETCKPIILGKLIVRPSQLVRAFLSCCSCVTVQDSKPDCCPAAVTILLINSKRQHVPALPILFVPKMQGDFVSVLKDITEALSAEAKEDVQFAACKIATDDTTFLLYAGERPGLLLVLWPFSV